MTRTDPADIEFPAPPCPLCNQETTADPDEFYCFKCRATWAPDGTFRRWDDEEQCEFRGAWLQRCVLELGHEPANSRFDHIDRDGWGIRPVSPPPESSPPGG